jgi:uncharacterized membrane protein
MRDVMKQYRRQIVSGLRNWRRLLAGLRNRLLAGVAVSIPIVVTVEVLKVAYKFINGISEQFLKPFGIDYPGFPFLVTLLVIFVIGAMATHVIGRRVLDWCERMLLRVPVVASIYNGVKQIVDSFKSFNNPANFKRVVYVEYPSQGCKLIGFVTGQFFDPVLKRDMTSVVVPTAPNPTTGLVLVVESHRVIESALSLEEAMKLIVSAGLVVPKKKVPLPMVREGVGVVVGGPVGQ